MAGVAEENEIIPEYNIEFERLCGTTLQIYNNILDNENSNPRLVLDLFIDVCQKLDAERLSSFILDCSMSWPGLIREFLFFIQTIPGSTAVYHRNFVAFLQYQIHECVDFVQQHINTNNQRMLKKIVAASTLIAGLYRCNIINEDIIFDWMTYVLVSKKNPFVQMNFVYNVKKKVDFNLNQRPNDEKLTNFVNKMNDIIKNDK